MNRTMVAKVATLSLAAALCQSAAWAEHDTSQSAASTGNRTSEGTWANNNDRGEKRESAKDAREQVQDAVKVVNQMKRDPKLTRLMQKAKGVLIVPDYGKAAIGVGGYGGEGVLLVQKNGEWSSPAFYNVGGVTVGAQAGVATGAVAMLLMTDNAVKQIRNDDNSWSLDANAGLTVINYSANAKASAGHGDVIAWSDTEGLFAGASVGISDINWDDNENYAYYTRGVTSQNIFNGTAKNPNAEALRDALPQPMAAG